MDINFSENLFLEVKELNRFKKSIVDNGYKRILKSIVKSFGIVENSGNTYFKVSRKAGNANKIIVNKGIAFDSDLNAIILDEDKEIDVTSLSTKSWVVISHKDNHDEEGTVNISEAGVLSGKNTKFTEVLRSGYFPIRVSFTSSKNKRDYEVQQVASDTSAILSGSFVAENDLKYQVVGTFTPGYQPSEENKHIYTYDDCDIKIIQSDSKPLLDGNHFILCSIERNSVNNIVDIADWRYSNMLNNSVTDNAIDKDNPGAAIRDITNLFSTAVVGTDNTSIALELILEHGYKINKYEFTTTSSSNIINITSGTCNYINSIGGNIFHNPIIVDRDDYDWGKTGGAVNDIPDSIFSNWIVVNRSNMKKARILNNIKGQLFLSDFDSKLLDGDNIDLVIIPNYREIEYEVSINGSVEMPSIPFTFRHFLTNYRTRNVFNIFHFMRLSEFNYKQNPEVKIRYRYIDNNGGTTPFKGLNPCGYFSLLDGYQTLASSSFNIDLERIRPKEKKRNYS